VSYLLVGGIACVLALVLVAAVVVFFVVRAERRHDEATGALVRLAESGPTSPGTTGDVSLFLRFDGEGASAMRALVARFAPHGIVPPAEVGAVALEVLASLDHATHGEIIVAAYGVRAVRSAAAGGVVICVRAQSRAPLEVASGEMHRKHLRDLLRAIAALDEPEVVSGDVLLAPITSDGSAPELRVLLGPHGTPSILP
jgi:hypothetical protein